MGALDTSRGGTLYFCERTRRLTPSRLSRARIDRDEQKVIDSNLADRAAGAVPQKRGVQVRHSDRRLRRPAVPGGHRQGGRLRADREHGGAVGVVPTRVDAVGEWFVGHGEGAVEGSVLGG